MKDKKPMGMYIHIPFCNRKCDYCDFVSYSMDEEAQHQYLDALFLEIDRCKERFMDETFDTLYIGGGTPSIVFDGFILSLARKIFSSFHFIKDKEFTIEVNPSSFNRKKFIEYNQAGVNRISVGVQCLDSKLLAEEGRIQSMENIEETFQILTECEYENVSSDVLIGLPDQSIESVQETLEYLIEKNAVAHGADRMLEKPSESEHPFRIRTLHRRHVRERRCQTFVSPPPERKLLFGCAVYIHHVTGEHPVFSPFFRRQISGSAVKPASSCRSLQRGNTLSQQAGNHARQHNATDDAVLNAGIEHHHRENKHHNNNGAHFALQKRQRPRQCHQAAQTDKILHGAHGVMVVSTMLALLLMWMIPQFILLRVICLMR